MAHILNTFSDSVTLGSTGISLGLQKLGMRAWLVIFRQYCSSASVHVGLGPSLHVELMQVTKLTR